MIEWYWVPVTAWLSVTATMWVVMWGHGRPESRRDWETMVAALLWPFFLLGALSDL